MLHKLGETGCVWFMVYCTVLRKNLLSQFDILQHRLGHLGQREPYRDFLS